MTINLEEIRQRADAATDGPWVREWAFGTYFVVPDDAGTVASDNVARLKPADVEFIAHAREDVPALLAHIADLTAELDKRNEVVEAARAVVALMPLSYGDVDDLEAAQGNAESALADAVHVLDGEHLINGVPADQWGTWCKHGKRIVEPDPTDPEPNYPRGRIVEPWPCDADGCTREQFERDMAEEAAAYEAERYEEYLRAVTP